jgi:hypothetical protein
MTKIVPMIPQEAQALCVARNQPLGLALAKAGCGLHTEPGLSVIRMQYTHTFERLQNNMYLAEMTVVKLSSLSHESHF